MAETEYRATSSYLHLPRPHLVEGLLSDLRLNLKKPDQEILEFQRFCAALTLVVDSGYFQVVEAMNNAAWSVHVGKVDSDKLSSFTKYMRLLLQLVHKAQFEPIPQQEYLDNINATSYLHSLAVKTDLEHLRKHVVDPYALESFFRTHHFWPTSEQSQIPMPEYGTTMLIYTRGTSEISQKEFFLWEKLNYLAKQVFSVGTLVMGLVRKKKQATTTTSSSPKSKNKKDHDSDGEQEGGDDDDFANANAHGGGGGVGTSCIFTPQKVAKQQLHDMIRSKGFFSSLFSNLELLHPTYREVLVMYVQRSEQGKQQQQSNSSNEENSIHSKLVSIELYRDIPMKDLSLVLPEPTILLPPFDKLTFVIQGVLLMSTFYTTYDSYMNSDNPAEKATSDRWSTAILYVTVFATCLVQIFMKIYAYMTYMHYYNREVLKWRTQRTVCSGPALLSHLHGEVREQEVKEALLCYYVLYAASKSSSGAGGKQHMTEAQLDAEVERFLCDIFGTEFDFDVVDAIEKLCALGLLYHESGKGYRVQNTPSEFLDKAHPCWLDFFQSLLKVPPPPV